MAHGLDSHSKEDYDVFEELVLKFALDLDKDMKKFLKETKFIKSTINEKKRFKFKLESKYENNN